MVSKLHSNHRVIRQSMIDLGLDVRFEEMILLITKRRIGNE